MGLVVTNSKQGGYGRTILSKMNKKHRPMVLLVSMGGGVVARR